ncbi:MAG: hypothetical protein FWH14_06465 [Oscillospiraceae bacterium]|nr:hypothetical protein [Oscillospiraceae bacterium]
MFMEIASSLAGAIGGRPEFANTIVTTDYENKKKPDVLSQDYITIGICGLKIERGTLGGLEGYWLNGSEATGSEVDAEAVITALSPHGADFCVNMPSVIADMLMQNFGAYSISCKEVKYDRNMRCWSLPVTVRIKYLMTGGG